MFCKYKNLYKFNKRKLLLVVFLLLLALLSTFEFGSFVSAKEQTEIDIETEMSSSITEIVNGLDLSEMQNLIDEINDVPLAQMSIKDRLMQILKGEYFTNYSSVISAVFALILGDVRSILPFVFCIIAIGILSNILFNFKSDNKNTSDIVSFVFMAVLIITILVAFKNILSLTSNTFNLILRQMQIIFPILITLLGTIGSFSSISIYNPLVAVLTTCVNVVFEKLLYPIFITIFLLSILGSLTKTVKLNKINDFLSSSFKWIIGIVFTLFSGFLTIQGISAGKFDSVSIKATKFAMKSYIPIIGSYISDGMDFFVLGAVLVKNSIGLIGVLILFLSIISPIITIIMYKLALQLCSGVLELSGNDRMSGFLSNCSKILMYPIVLILGVAFMYIITICLIMCTANIF